ncbi:MAG: tRNA (pseudouridine(54)-N(1))-methyltransferase TrmY [Nitrososphaerota archaeon]|nr:tRNA (pseudouridine(54)-N(1))-methyltransferase TrmY [Candidatus Bathyarchaeota archaeon]MDW8024191.1 tRNA (pseudouridine(54)-N(1))-methyltransferase TrmY [Nitrososphaerota archaeon]
MREFVLYSRMGRTDSNWKKLHDAGRLDIVYECIIASLFLSHAIRRDAAFHTILNGPPRPPVHLEINGEALHDVRTDQETWEKILKKVLAGKEHPGIRLSKESFESLIKAKAGEAQIYVLEEGGKDILEVEIGENSVFVLGDHVGLPRKVESFALRYGEKISLGKKPYLAATCITILNYMLDRRETPKN